MRRLFYLCKAAMDIVAKHTEPDANGVRIAELDEMRYRELWQDALQVTAEAFITKTCYTNCSALTRSF